MKLFNELPNSRPAPPGRERVVLRKLPMVLLAGTLIPLFTSLASRVFPIDGTATQIAKHLSSIDILAIATGLTVWFMVFTVAIVCLFVMIAKGPAYVADSYPLRDWEEPGKRAG